MPLYEASPALARHNGDEMAGTRYVRNIGIPGFMPIFAGRMFTILNETVTIEPGHEYPVQYAIFCPGFSVRVFGTIRRDGPDDPEFHWAEPIPG